MLSPVFQITFHEGKSANTGGSNSQKQFCFECNTFILSFITSDNVGFTVSVWSRDSLVFFLSISLYKDAKQRVRNVSDFLKCLNTMHCTLESSFDLTWYCSRIMSQNTPQNLMRNTWTEPVWAHWKKTCQQLPSTCREQDGGIVLLEHLQTLSYQYYLDCIFLITQNHHYPLSMTDKFNFTAFHFSFT